MGTINAIASDEPSNQNFLEEWKIARSVLKEFDKDLHDLRKYGFTFLTALLAAESILIPSWLKVGENTTVLPDNIKLAILLINLILIFALQLIDRNYQVFQSAASKRARVIERILNLELTEVIAQRYDMRNVQGYVTGVYAIFILGVSFLGTVVLLPHYSGVLWLAAIIALIAVIILNNRYMTLNYPYGMLDWTLDRLQCKIGDEVGITLTNLMRKRPSKEPEPIKFEDGTIMWQIVKEADGSVVKTETADRLPPIRAEDSYTWLWKTDKDLDEGKTLEGGIYRVHRVTQDKKGQPSTELTPLRRKLKISS